MVSTSAVYESVVRALAIKLERERKEVQIAYCVYNYIMLFCKYFILLIDYLLFFNLYFSSKVIVKNKVTQKNNMIYNSIVICFPFFLRNRTKQGRANKSSSVLPNGCSSSFHPSKLV